MALMGGTNDGSSPDAFTSVVMNDAAAFIVGCSATNSESVAGIIKNVETNETNKEETNCNKNFYNNNC